MLRVAKVDQRIEPRHRLENDIAALAAVASVGAAIFDELLAPEADRSRSARAGADEDLRLVEEMHARAVKRRSEELPPRLGCQHLLGLPGALELQAEHPRRGLLA